MKDRIEELETRIKSNQEFERRIERIESRLGINEMMRLVERNRELEEKIKEEVSNGASALCLFNSYGFSESTPPRNLSFRIRNSDDDLRRADNP